MSASAILPVMVVAAVKGSMVVAAVALVCRIVRGFGPAVRHSLWLAAILSFPLCMAAATLPLSLAIPAGRAGRVAVLALQVMTGPTPTEPGATAGVAVSAGTPAGSAPTTVGNGRAVLALLWCAGVLAGWARLTLGAWKVGRLLGASKPLSGADLRLASACREDLVPGRPVRFLVSPLAAPAFTIGTLRPVVLVPRGAAREPDALRAVILHELAHVRRLDFLTQRLSYLACCLFWFLPLPWLALRRLREEQERACDQAVIGRGVAPVAYAAVLVEAMRNTSPAATPAFGSATRSLERRLRIILSSANGKESIMKRARWFVPIVFGLIVPLALARCARTTPQAADAAQIAQAATYYAAPWTPLAWPLTAHAQGEQDPTPGALTLPFGEQPNPLETGATYYHRGIDLAGIAGTPVVAAADGTVVFAGSDSTGTRSERPIAYGCYVELDHGDGYRTLYAHIQDPAEVRTGDPVKRGQLVGRVGDTGISTGPHLHFEVLKDGTPIDPQTVLPRAGS